MTLARTLPATATPKDTPTFTLKVDGSELKPSYEVSSIVVIRHVNKVTTAEVIIYDGEPAGGNFEASSSSDFEPGKKLSVELGYRSSENTVFQGIIIGQSIKVYTNKPSTLTITCKHEAVKLTIGRRTAYFYNKRDNEIIDQISRDQGVQISTSPTSVVHAEMVQYYATDWDFLVTRAEANGQLVFVEDDKIKIEAPRFAQPTALEIQYGATVLNFEAEMDARTQYQSVDAFAWQPQKQSMEQVNARDPGVVSPGNLSSKQLSNTIGISSFEIRHAGHMKDVELQEWANAQWLKSQLAKIRGRVRIQGASTIQPGQIIELGGFGNRFNGKAYVTGLRQELTVNNWETDIMFGLDPAWFCRQYDDIDTMPAEGLLPAVAGLQVGVVTKLEADPEGEDRIRVRLPMLDNQGEGVWARVACLDAGNERGTFFRPEINDEVIVGFLSNDPRHPVVLGQLNSSQKPAPVTVQDTNHEKGIYTRDKLKLVFNDEKKSVTIETPAQNQIVFSDDDKSIVVSDEHGNSIKMSADGIVLESAKDIILKASAAVKIESGANTEISASAQLKAEGSAGAELSASGNTVIKGAVVQIN